jgi:hypothetical protein
MGRLLGNVVGQNVTREFDGRAYGTIGFGVCRLRGKYESRSLLGRGD